MTVRDEILQIGRELNLTDTDMCNFMCMTEDEFRNFKTGKFIPTIFNLILWVSSVEQPLETLLPRPNFVWVPVADHRK